ncbi:unnamed protein product [Pleuronectes platessa]|uniref:Uncharacterized protein n=1 Tax=Pleuronectes platessa TaxID=8262 RepID=A0A9N7UHF1_PLEPL|nr:unnamed protein product [Pleuronectes platessa]
MRIHSRRVATGRVSRLQMSDRTKILVRSQTAVVLPDGYGRSPRLKYRGRLKRKELPWLRRHCDLRGAMETPVMGWEGRRGEGDGWGPVMLTCLCLQRLTIC